MRLGRPALLTIWDLCPRNIELQPLIRLPGKNRNRSQSLPQPQMNIATTKEEPRQEPARKMTFTSRLLMTAVVVFIWVLALLAINKTDAFRGREKFLPASGIAPACFLLVYLVLIHGKDVVNLFTMAGNKIEAVQEKQAQRGKKAGEAIKTLNKMMDEAGKQPPPTERGEEKDN